MTYNVFGGTLNSTQSIGVMLDEFAEKAEQQCNLSFMTKSNALRKAAKEKDSDLKLVDHQLSDKLLSLSNW